MTTSLVRDLFLLIKSHFNELAWVFTHIPYIGIFKLIQTQSLNLTARMQTMLRYSGSSIHIAYNLLRFKIFIKLFEWNSTTMCVLLRCMYGLMYIY